MARTAPITQKGSTTASPATSIRVETASAEIRIIVAVNEKVTTEYTVMPVGGGDKARGYNVTPAHDPNGGFILEKHAATPDAAIQDFSARFHKDKVSVSGGGDCFVVVHDGKVLACEKNRPAAVEASERLAAPKGEDGTGGVTGTVHPATSAVRDTFQAVGTEGTRVIVYHGGLVALAH
jgi:hypothetical protein